MVSLSQRSSSAAPMNAAPQPPSIVHCRRYASTSAPPKARAVIVTGEPMRLIRMKIATPVGVACRCRDSSNDASKRVRGSCVATFSLIAPSRHNASTLTATLILTPRKVELAKSSRGAFARLASLLFPVAGWGLDRDGIDQPSGDGRDVVHRGGERRLIGLRWVRHAAQLTHELDRGRPNLIVCRRRLEVRQRLDVSAHRLLPCETDEDTNYTHPEGWARPTLSLRTVLPSTGFSREPMHSKWGYHNRIRACRFPPVSFVACMESRDRLNPYLNEESEIAMKFLVMVKANKDSEAGVMPDER